MSYRVTNTTRQKVLATGAKQARGFGERFLGLMGRKTFVLGDGLQIIPCNGIHTFFMRIPIDALFLDADLRVVKAFPALPPWRATSIYPAARSVLELPAGVIQATGTREGDALLIEPAG